MSSRVLTGLDRLAAQGTWVRGRRVGLLANQAAVTCELEPAWELVPRLGGVLVRMFAPEHGLFGLAQDMEAVGHHRWRGVPVVSLYGASVDSLKPRPELLADLDLLVVDLPDIGCRYYTFAATMAYALAACEAAGVEVVVCDRPNPLGGEILEGGPVEACCRSFVSELPVPVRHGMTLGELALLLQTERHPKLTLTVLACEGWSRGAWWDETGLPWVAPSPNMPTLATATVYPGACLVEATNLSEGRGTTRPFLLTGAPWLDGEALARRLNALELPGIMFRPTFFRPEFQKHAGTVCGGVEWHVTNRHAFHPLATGIVLLREVRRLHPDRFAWRAEPYEFLEDPPAIDLLTGSPLARQVVEGERELDEVLEQWEGYCREFREYRRQFLLASTSRSGAEVG
ncbi:MAG: exo-beta-N-acetylmuramidase NamZ family protein [Thermoanaerobaculum sp.]